MSRNTNISQFMTIQNLNHLENPASMGPLPKILDTNNPIAKKSRIVFV